MRCATGAWCSSSFVIMPLAVPLILAGMSALGARKQVEKLEATLELPVIGAERAPNLMAWLGSHNLRIVAPPADRGRRRAQPGPRSRPADRRDVRATTGAPASRRASSWSSTARGRSSRARRSSGARAARRVRPRGGHAAARCARHPSVGVEPAAGRLARRRDARVAVRPGAAAAAVPAAAARLHRRHAARHRFDGRRARTAFARAAARPRRRRARPSSAARSSPPPRSRWCRSP